MCITRPTLQTFVERRALKYPPQIDRTNKLGLYFQYTKSTKYLPKRYTSSVYKPEAYNKYWKACKGLDFGLLGVKKDKTARPRFRIINYLLDKNKPLHTGGNIAILFSYGLKIPVKVWFTHVYTRWELALAIYDGYKMLWHLGTKDYETITYTYGKFHYPPTKIMRRREIWDTWFRRKNEWIGPPLDKFVIKHAQSVKIVKYKKYVDRFYNLAIHVDGKPVSGTAE